MILVNMLTVLLWSCDYHWGSSWSICWNWELSNSLLLPGCHLWSNGLGRWRMLLCVNYHKLNKVSKFNAYLWIMLKISIKLLDLQSSCLLWTLPEDISRFLSLKKVKRNWLHLSLFEFLIMQFGLHSAPATEHDRHCIEELHRMLSCLSSWSCCI